MKIGMSEFEAKGTVFGMQVQTVGNNAANSADATAALLPLAAAAAILGVTFGSAVSILYLYLYHKKHSDGISKEMFDASPKPRSYSDTMKILIKTAIPIGIGAIATNVASLIDTTFLQTRIADIIEADPAPLYAMYEGLIPGRNLELPETIPNFLYGCYTNALTLYMLIPSITQAFGISALPSMTSAWTSGDKTEIKKSMEAVLRISALFSIPAGLGMSVMAMPISKLIFGNRDAVEITAYVLMIIGIAAIFASISTPLNSMLQAVGRVDVPVKLLCIGLLLKILCTYIVVGIPEINILGAGVGTFLCYGFSAVAAVIILCKITKIVPNLVSVFLKPLIAAVACVVCAYGSYALLMAVIPGMFRINVLLSIALACAVYAISLLLLKALSKDDILMLPKGQKIVKVLEKHNFIM